jgi:hypothetical protein
MSTKQPRTYDAKEFGGEEEEKMVQKFHLQLDDAKSYFERVTKPMADRAYKLYIAYNGDRAREIESWQANVHTPYIQAVVETLIPRILDARPELSVQGRNVESQSKASRLQNLADFTWEMASMDSVAEDVSRSSLITGTGYMQPSWKKDVRTHKFLSSKTMVGNKKLKWEEREQVFYDAPTCEWVDNYDLWYDWHNCSKESKQYWFKRLVLTGSDIRRRYPMHDKDRIEAAFASGYGCLENYAEVRISTKMLHDRLVRGADRYHVSGEDINRKYANSGDPDLMFYEVFEWWRPFDDKYAVMVNGVPILKEGSIPIPYDFKEAPFIAIPYLRMPGEFEGIGLPHLLENPQMMLNMIKNQRLDAATLSIHKMWIVNPLAGIDKTQLVARPFAIIYSPDPQGVREVQFSDIKPSAYREEELLKGDMRHASGVDDFSMGSDSGSSSATAVRHLRESTLERVRMYVNHMGAGYSELLRYWISMYGQFFTEKMTIRIVGDDGKESFPIIERDDLKGFFDFKATVIPSIAGKNDIDKKQGMDLYQLLINLPFVDPRKLTSKVLHYFNWSLDSVSKQEGEGEMPPEMAGMAQGEGEMPPEMAEMMQGGGIPSPNLPMSGNSGEISPEMIQQALSLLGGAQGVSTQSPFQEMSRPQNLLKSGGLPPTVKGVSKTTNPRGLNMGGKVNTNIPVNRSYAPEEKMYNRASNIQR